MPPCMNLFQLQVYALNLFHLTDLYLNLLQLTDLCLNSVSAHRSMITSVSAHRSMFESASDADHRSKFESDFRSQISLWIFLRSQTYVWTCFGWAFSWSCDSWILPNDFAHLNWWTEKLAHITSRPDMKSFWWWQFKLHIGALSSLPPGTAVPVNISWGQISTEASALSSEPHHP